MTAGTRTRVAALDCGTNSLRLLVADVDPSAGTLHDVLRRMEIVRLGQDVDRTGELSADALSRTLAMLREYAQDIERLGAERVRLCATSAIRDATNRDEFVSGVQEILGVAPDVVVGTEEARLSFIGATRELAAGVLPTPYLVVDIGGGSTEFVLGTGDVEAATSVDIGCVRLTERHLRDDPPAPSQVDDAVADIDEALDAVRAEVAVQNAATLIGLAGSVTTVAALALQLAAYDPDRLHYARVSRAEVRDITNRLLTMGHRSRAALPAMHPGRVDIIGAGALVLLRTMERFDFAEVVASEHDILDGIAWSLV
jgi:exopolyphosphatase/guanosine-5'-triphosphate,3'-diphosphate pyrophosphatase